MKRPFRLALPFAPLFLAACASEPAAPQPVHLATETEQAAPATPVEPTPAPTPVAISEPVPPELIPAEVGGATPGAAGIGDSLIPEQGNGGYDVESYDIALDLEAAAGPLRGTTRIRATATQHLSRFNLDFHGMTVDAITIDGAAATFAREADELIVTPAAPLALGKAFDCTVTYNGKP